MVRLIPALLLLGCASSPTPAPTEAPRLVFLRDAVLASPGSGGRPVGGDRELLLRSWTPGEAVTAGPRSDPAPARPECVPLFSQDLGDVDSLVARGVSAPGTSLAWSPSGDRLAVGSYLGEVLVLDGWTGDVLARRKLAETMVKQVAWADDGKTLYAGEQSPDAFVHALDPTDLSSRWSVPLSDELESSPPPPDTDVYGVFTLPAAYALHVLPDGSLLVAGLHSWTSGDDQKQNRSRIYRFSPDGEVLAAWPPEGPADATLRFPQIDGDRVAFPVGRTASGPAPEGLPIDGIQVLTLPELTPHAAFVNQPLLPHFTRASVWEAVDIAGERVLVGFGDGRLQVVPLDGSERHNKDLGTPVVSGEVPISAAIGWSHFLDGGGYVASTGRTSIPWGSDVTASRPPGAHPGEYTVWAYAADDSLRWNWRSEVAIQGLSVTPDGRRLVVGGGPRESDRRRDRFGAWVLKLDREGSGEDRFEVACATEAPVFYQHAATNDGRIAVSELPWLESTDSAVQGAYRVTVLR